MYTGGQPVSQILPALVRALPSQALGTLLTSALAAIENAPTAPIRLAHIEWLRAIVEHSAGLPVHSYFLHGLALTNRRDAVARTAPTRFGHGAHPRSGGAATVCALFIAPLSWADCVFSQSECTGRCPCHWSPPGRHTIGLCHLYRPVIPRFGTQISLAEPHVARFLGVALRALHHLSALGAVAAATSCPALVGIPALVARLVCAIAQHRLQLCSRMVHAVATSIAALCALVPLCSNGDPNENGIRRPRTESEEAAFCARMDPVCITVSVEAALVCLEVTAPSHISP